MQQRSLIALAAGVLCLAACGGSAASTPSATTTRSAATSPIAGSTPSLPAEPADPTPPVAIPVAGAPPVAGRPWYLAVGDSITFGFSIDPARSGRNSSWALLLQPLLARRGQPWSLFDTACPGERTDTYRTLCPGRLVVPMELSTSQHDVAMRQVSAHGADLEAILIDLGSNDLLRALRTGVDPVTAGGRLRTNLTEIIADYRTAAPGVPIVLANFYNPLADSDPSTRTQLSLVNQLVAAVAQDNGALLADFFTAINGPGTTLCTMVDCAHHDIHPTVRGQQALAAAALAAIPATR